MTTSSRSGSSTPRRLARVNSTRRVAWSLGTDRIEGIDCLVLHLRLRGGADAEHIDDGVLEFLGPEAATSSFWTPTTIYPSLP